LERLGASGLLGATEPKVTLSFVVVPKSSSTSRTGDKLESPKLKDAKPNK
jgi:hypothetical protein